MKRTIAMIAAVSLTCLALASCAPSSNEAPTAENSKTDASQSQQIKLPPADTKECLSCHPYDEVMSKSENYVDAESGPVNPHRTIDENAEKLPHESADGAPTDCGECHTSHAITSDGKAENVEVPSNLDSCYASCHHNRNFEACSSCHTDKY